MASSHLHLLLCILTATILSGTQLAAGFAKSQPQIAEAGSLQFLVSCNRQAGTSEAILQTPNALTQSGEDAVKLIDALKLARLPPEIRPVKNMSQPVTIFYGLSLINFESLDEVQGILHLNLWARYLWRDEYSKWEPSEYNGITTLRRPLSEVWQPDLSVYNEREPIEQVSKLVVIYNDGSVLYIPPMQTKTHCDLDLTYFPFDIQTCSIKIGSWTHDGHSIALDFYEGQEKIDLSDYVHNAEWDILKTAAKHTNVYYPCCTEPYPDITYNLTIQRKTSYYTYVYLGPAVILSLLVPFIFLLPPGDQQKVTLGVGILICFTLFFMEISTLIPTVHGHTPLIDRYYMATYVLVALSMALSTLVANLARRAHTLRHPPEFLTKLMLGCLGRCLCVRHSDYSGLLTEEQSIDVKTEAGGKSVQRQESTGNQVTQWHMIAVVLDRLLFLIFLVLSVLVALCILTIRPRA